MPDLTPLVAAIPALGALVRVLSTFFGGDLDRRLHRHARLLADLPEGVETADLRVLIDKELKELTRREDARLHRKVSWSMVSAMGFVLVVGTVVSAGLWQWDPGLGDWLVIALRVVAVLFALFAALVAFAGLSNLWDDTRDTTSASDSEGTPSGQ